MTLRGRLKNQKATPAPKSAPLKRNTIRNYRRDAAKAINYRPKRQQPKAEGFR